MLINLHYTLNKQAEKCLAVTVFPPKEKLGYMSQIIQLSKLKKAEERETTNTAPNDFKGGRILMPNTLWAKVPYDSSKPPKSWSS